LVIDQIDLTIQWKLVGKISVCRC